MGQQKGGKKLRRTGKDKGYYTQGYERTVRNKARRAQKRLSKRAFRKAKQVAALDASAMKVEA